MFSFVLVTDGCVTELAQQSKREQKTAHRENNTPTNRCAIMRATQKLHVDGVAQCDGAHSQSGGVKNYASRNISAGSLIIVRPSVERYSALNVFFNVEQSTRDR